MTKRIRLDQDTVAELDYNVWEITQKHPFEDSTSSIQLNVSKFKKMGLVPIEAVLEILNDKIDVAEREAASRNHLALLNEFSGTGRDRQRAIASLAAERAQALKVARSQIKDLA